MQRILNASLTDTKKCIPGEHRNYPPDLYLRERVKRRICPTQISYLLQLYIQIRDLFLLVRGIKFKTIHGERMCNYMLSSCR